MYRLLFLILCALLCASATAQERLTDFDVTLTVSPDGPLHVVERITAVAEGDRIKRGIYRTLLRKGGLDYNILSVERDGRTEDYHTENSGGATKVYVGSSDVFLDPGTYAYTLEYEVDYALQPLDDADEIYWQITGTAWDFPIEEVTATINFPAGTKILRYACYTGGADEAGRDCRALQQVGSNSLVVSSTRALRPGEGLTVAAAVPKGLFAVAEPPAPWKREAVFYILGLGLLGGLFYAVESWSRYGRDPELPAVPIQFEPPAGVSPAAAAYLHSEQGKAGQFAATILELARRGYLTIEPEEKSGFLGIGDYYVYHLRATETTDRSALSPEQRLAYEALFAGDGVYTLKGKYDKALAGIVSKHHTATSGQYDALMKRGRNLVRLLPLIGIFLVTLILGAVFFRYNDSGYGAIALFGFAAIGFIGCILYGFLINQPTPEKALLLERIKKFRAYLSLKESKRRTLPGAPPMNEALYERWLPYAVGLGISEQWTAYFEDMVQLNRNYRPHYYYGSGGFRPDTFGKNFQQAVSSGSTAPSSSGGSGGGGSVGGGGGGGGGGGW